MTEENRTYVVDQRPVGHPVSLADFLDVLQPNPNKRLVLIGWDYRGTLVYQRVDGTCFVLDRGLQYDFITDTEAEAFVDATISMSGKLLDALV